MLQIARCIHRSDPAYTPEAIAANIEGIVELSGTVGEDGIPSDVRVIQPLGFGLDENAIKCVLEWRFTPPAGLRSIVGCRFYVKFELPDSK